MQYQYFDLARPDDDDEGLKEAIREGLVPPTCLAGGELLIRLPSPPCETCPASEMVRKRCGGPVSHHRFPDPTGGEAAKWAAGRHQAALRSQRDRQREALDAFFTEEE